MPPNHVIYRQQRSIAAPDNLVFQVIADLANYHQWNPWIRSASGNTTPGSIIEVTALMGKRRQHYRHRILAADSPELFHWCDIGWFTLFAYGERKRTIRRLSDEHCCYTVELRISGIARGIAQHFFGRAIELGMAQEADALQQYCEAIFTH